MLAISDLTTGALLAAFMSLCLLAYQVISNVQRGRERTEDFNEAHSDDKERDLARCLERTKVLEQMLDMTDRKYNRLLRLHDDERST